MLTIIHLRLLLNGNIVDAIMPIENRNKVVHWSWKRSVNIMYNTIKRYDNEIN
jgi:hypothetical protein